MKKGILFSLFLSNMIWCSTTFSQNIGVNGTGATPDESAILDVDAPDKGILVPRVSLTDTSDVTTILSPETSLVVYNDNASMTGGVGEGFYSYDGARWVPLVQAAIPPGTKGQVLASQGTGVLPEWKPDTISTSATNSNLGVGGCTDCPVDISTIPAGTRTWADVSAYCRDLTEGGYTDWRMPTFEELTYLSTTGVVLGTFKNKVAWTATRVEILESKAVYINYYYTLNPVTGEKDIKDGTTATNIKYRRLCVR